MWPALGFTSPSMYLSARSAVGSLALTFPVRNRPVSTTPVTPGLLLVLQPPPSSWLLLRYLTARVTTRSHSAGAGPRFFPDWAGAGPTRPGRAPARAASATPV